MPATFILTSEHAINEIPTICKHLAELEFITFYSTISRLLVEANRSTEKAFAKN